MTVPETERRQKWQEHSLLEASLARGWSQLAALNVYRLIVAITLLLINLMALRWRPFGQNNPEVFLAESVLYALFSVGSAFLIAKRWLNFSMQRGLMVVGDILFINLMMAVSGGARSGLGLLLLISLASSALVIEGRMLMFYTALATTTILLNQLSGVLLHQVGVTDIGQAGLLGMAFFVSSAVASILAERNRKSEALADKRAVALRSMAQINQLVIDDMQDGVIVLDGDGYIRQTNQRARELLGVPVTDWPEAEHALDVYLPHVAAFYHVWRGKPNMRFEPVVIGETGALYMPRFIAVTNRRVNGSVLVLEDMSRIREAARQIKLAALGRLTANIAHEIRNPMTAISHASELLQESEDAVNHRLLEIILNNTRRINQLINDVMMLARRDRVQREQIIVADFLSDFLEEFSHDGEFAPYLFVAQVADDFAICFDAGHLRQVLANLCSNALRHASGKPGCVMIRCDHERSQTVIDVLDDGPGVPANLQARLFEPFFTTVPTGTGLGLYISRELCQANGAWLDYVATGTGGHFRISSQDNRCQEQIH